MQQSRIHLDVDDRIRIKPLKDVIGSNGIEFRFFGTLNYYFRMDKFDRVLKDNRHLKKCLQRFFKCKIRTIHFNEKHTNAVLARNVQGFEQAKKRATELRKSLKLKWDQVKFKSEKRKSNFGVSNSGKSYTDSYGNKTKVQYARNYNPSKRRHFRGGINSDGTSFDID